MPVKKDTPKDVQATEQRLNVIWLNPKTIKYSKNPRTQKNEGFLPENMANLRSGIQQDGLLNALLVRLVAGTKDEYQLVGGERRLRSILRLLEDDEQAQKDNTERVICKNARTGKMEPACDSLKLTECKVTDCPDDAEARRLAILDNMLHSALNDYELLLQVDEMERDGISRALQAKTLKVSEAWISQSHSLLECNPLILEHIESGKLCRTAAITFLSVPKDKIEAVLNRALHLMYADAEQKEADAKKEKEDAKEMIARNQDILEVAKYTGNTKQQNKARRAINRAGKTIQKADKKIEGTKNKGQKKMTVETIVRATKDIAGANDKLKRPVSTKQLRIWHGHIGELLEKDGPLKRPDNGKVHDRTQAGLLHKFLGMAVGEVKVDHPFDLI